MRNADRVVTHGRRHDSPDQRITAGPAAADCNPCSSHDGLFITRGSMTLPPRKLSPDILLHEELLNYLQQALPLLSRLVVTSRQTGQDAAAALVAVEHAVGKLRTYARDRGGKGGA